MSFVHMALYRARQFSKGLGVVLLTNNESGQYAPEGRYRARPRAIVTMNWVAVLLLVIPALSVAETELDFHLCSTYLQKSVLGEQTEHGWPVFIKLTETGATSFEEFTEAKVGRMSRIVVGSREFLRATIQVPVSSGVLQRSFSSQLVAMAWQRTLESKLPAAPCGAGSL